MRCLTPIGPPDEISRDRNPVTVKKGKTDIRFEKC
jgi:hypothetical protein